MGGQALKNTETRRYSKDEFYALWDELKPMVKDHF